MERPPENEIAPVFGGDTCICVFLCTRVNESRLCVKKKKEITSRAVDGLGWYSACVWMQWELKGDERSGSWLQTRCYCSHGKSISMLLGKGREVKKSKLITECNKNKSVWYINTNGQNPLLKQNNKRKKINTLPQCIDFFFWDTEAQKHVGLAKVSNFKRHKTKKCCHITLAHNFFSLVGC